MFGTSTQKVQLFAHVHYASLTATWHLNRHLSLWFLIFLSGKQTKRKSGWVAVETNFEMHVSTKKKCKFPFLHMLCRWAPRHIPVAPGGREGAVVAPALSRVQDGARTDVRGERVHQGPLSRAGPRVVLAAQAKGGQRRCSGHPI